MPRVGLVLGGGGLVGQAFHAGALAALEHDFGWDPRTADVVVGTSAGSVSGALLRAGLSASDLAAYFVDAPLSPGVTLEVTRPTLVPIRWQAAFRPPLPKPELLLRMARLPWLRSPLAALMALMPDGDLELLPHLEFIDDLTGGTWPEGDLRVTAVRQRDGRLVLFDGRDGDTPSLTSAVAASCAVPGYFRPVTIAGTRYVDGGLHSATNADSLRADELDLVIVVSPMSTDAPVRLSMDGMARRVATRRVRAEAAALRAAGHNVVVIEPGRDTLDAMNHDFMSGLVLVDTVRESFLDLGRAAAELHPRLREIFGARSRAA